MTIVDELYKNHIDLLEYVKNEPSLFSFADNTFKKVLVIAAASFFEEEIKNLLIEFASYSSSNNVPLINFLKNKAIDKKYHEYFQWDENSANSFFGLFGKDFKDLAIKDVEANPELDKAVKSFLELGKTRNDFSHKNFASINPDKTAEDYYNLYQSAQNFLSYLKTKILPVKYQEFNISNLFQFLFSDS